MKRLRYVIDLKTKKIWGIAFAILCYCENKYECEDSVLNS